MDPGGVLPVGRLSQFLAGPDLLYNLRQRRAPWLTDPASLRLGLVEKVTKPVPVHRGLRQGLCDDCGLIELNPKPQVNQRVNEA